MAYPKLNHRINQPWLEVIINIIRLQTGPGTYTQFHPNFGNGDHGIWVYHILHYILTMVWKLLWPIDSELWIINYIYIHIIIHQYYSSYINIFKYIYIYVYFSLSHHIPIKIIHSIRISPPTLDFHPFCLSTVPTSRTKRGARWTGYRPSPPAATRSVPTWQGQSNSWETGQKNIGKTWENCRQKLRFRGFFPVMWNFWVLFDWKQWTNLCKVIGKKKHFF